MEINKEIKKIRDEVIECQKCALGKTRILPVIGQGSHQANIIFVGEAPGANEDKTGVPFCGQSGNFLNELLDSIGIKREDVYICNILKCRPPNNRDPLMDEIKLCTPYLEKQIEAIKPKVIGTLGNYATGFILRKYGLDHEVKGIGQIHSKVFEVDVSFGKLKIIPLYHPAAAVYNANMKDILKEDFKVLKEHGQRK